METANKRLLIVEDNALIRQGFATVIQRSGNYQVVGQYGTCEEALKNLTKDCPDIVLMDIDLPGMNGIEGTSRIKKLYPNCIVLIITVVEDSDKVFQSLCAGAGGYLVKNTSVNALVTSIDEAVAGGAPMSLHIASLVVKSFAISHDSPLSNRETQVLQSIAQGKTYTKIAAELFINKETVRSHIRSIYHKLEVNNKSDALRKAGDHKWLATTL
ncbi:MAG: response regulator [Janthinobacterium lividum]